jgi:2-polyprenyl-3-methyl-5-hydroxy-6-metoxy-1,4-benzoquinol methylase
MAMKNVRSDTPQKRTEIRDTGERILPTREGEVSLVYSRHRFAYEYVSQFVGNKTVLDVGCGTGYGCAILAEKAESVYGIDRSEEAIAYCRSNYAAPNITFVVADVAAVSLGKKFDIAVTFQVIEHMRDTAAFIELLKRTVKRNGMIVISTPNVVRPAREAEANPFHFNEMNYTQLQRLISNHFSKFEMYGIAYARRNRFRSIVGKLPIIRWGKILTRKSTIKKIATRALDLDSFSVITSNVEAEAIDLLAVCYDD